MPVICGRVFMNGILTNACFIIENGKIVGVKKSVEGGKKDYGNAVIFPAAIDIHVHFREPGFEYKEDFFTGSRAAAMAGVTCVMDMPNNEPPVISQRIFAEKARKIRYKACVDYGLYMGIKGRVEKCDDCIGYKVFLSGDNEIFCSMEELNEAMKELGDSKPLAIHAEVKECIRRGGATNLREHERNRGKKCEIEAIKKIVEMSKEMKAKIHICHVTTPDSIKLLKGKVSFGVTLHHLLFSYKSEFLKEAMGKVNPPLRGEEERGELYRKFIKGEIPILESDHAPHTLEEKSEFETAPSGMPGVDATMPLMLRMVKKGEIDLQLLHRVMCLNPAKLFGVNKGVFERGKDADFIVIDFGVIKQLKALSKCGWSCYEGMEAIYPKHVYLRGEKIVDDYEFIGDAGMGRMIS
ncbi:MAG: dihydroorotase family protein [Thermoplasmata archaeon]|nr:dihydroorotase family protein [Thermoplasmata archaeon]